MDLRLHLLLGLLVALPQILEKLTGVFFGELGFFDDILSRSLDFGPGFKSQADPCRQRFL